jgi:Zn-dependent peptidase ImmA (M78 family)
MTTEFQETICRDAARRVLGELSVQKPDHIHLPTLAWLGGRRLIIEEGGLKTAEGRLVATADGGVIRIRSDIQPASRKRFTIAHEIGHRVLHGLSPSTDTLQDLRTWSKGSKETEANIFAGELLMPEFLFKPLVIRESPSLAFIDSLASEFRTSNLAAAVHFVMYTSEPCALVVSKNGNYCWSKKSPTFEFYIKKGILHKYTGAANLWAGKAERSGMQRTAAGAWLERFDLDDRGDIMEDSRRLDEFDMTVSLLWVYECI